MWKLTKLPHPAITVFGGSRIKLDDPIAQKATNLATQLVKAGFSIITGGGPGIMEAANFGAIEYLRSCDLGSPNCDKKLVSAGIGLIKLNRDKSNPYTQTYVVMSHFFARKWLLVRYSVGFVVFPGGFGTLDELFEVTTLIQCNKMPRVPVILIGTDYWAPIHEWIHTRALAQKLIDEKDAHLFHITDDINQAVSILKERSLQYTESIIIDDKGGKDDPEQIKK